MSHIYTGSGIRFIYPEDWGVFEQQRGEDLTVTVSDGEAAQWSVTILPARPELRHVLDETIGAFREEYADLDADEYETEIADQKTLAAELSFECLELQNTAFVRAFQTAEATFVVLYQATDHELPLFGPVFDAINESLQCGVAQADDEPS